MIGLETQQFPAYSDTAATTPHSDKPLVQLRDFAMVKGSLPFDLELYRGLTVIETGREAHATTLSLCLAGRMKPAQGVIALNVSGNAAARASEAAEKGSVPAEITAPRRRAPYVAIAGVTELDALERLVPVGVVAREQVAWSQRWFKRAPKDPYLDPRFAEWAEAIGLDVDPNAKVGDLSARERFQLRIVLGLIARPKAELLIVDDVDQLKSIDAIHATTEAMANLSRRISVVSVSVNGDPAGVADDHIRLASRFTQSKDREVAR